MIEIRLKRNINLTHCLAFLIIIFTPLLLVSETGRFSLTYQNQTLKNIDQNNDYTTTLNSIYLNLLQGLGKGSSFNFSINYYYDKGLSQVASYNLGLQAIPLGKFKMDVDFGTISYPLSSLPYFGSFNPTVYRGLKGGKITLRSDKTDLILFGGQLYSDFGYSTQSEKSKIYGARTIFRPSRRWTFGAGYMKLLDVPSGDPSAGGSTSDYDVFNLDTSIMTIKNLYLLGDFRYILDQSKKNKNGYAVKTGTYYNAGNVSFQIFYNYISPDYPTLGNIFFQDHKGITIVGQYRLAPWLSLFGSLDTFNEQLKSILGKSLGNFMTYRFGTTVSPKALPQFTASYNKSIKEYPEESSAGSGANKGTDFDMIFLSLSQNSKRFYWNIYFNRGTFNNQGEAAWNYSLNRIFLNLRWSYPAGHYIYLTGDLNQTTWQATETDNKNMNVQLGAYVTISSYFQFNIQGDYSIDKYTTSTDKNQRLGIGGGFIYRIKPLQMNCSIRYQYAKNDVSLPGETAKYSHQAFISITKDFKWGTDTSGLGLQGTAHARGTGKIKGSVFVDINQNDMQDPGEDSLEDIPILVDNYQTVKTDKNGHFAVSSIPVGVHQISLDLSKVPASFEANRDKTEVTIKKGETGKVYLTVIPVGLAAGQVILDLNENGAPDKDEPLLADIRVNLFKEDKLIRWEFTNSKGVFTFDNLRPGTYIIKTDEESIYEKYNGIDKATVEVTVKPWEEKKDLLLLLSVYKKSRVKKVLDY
ncbi:MAG: hypothetical protein QG657_2853 [Acidobacteriota bacterium]|nr:hypothetical protein [Acidobacteriota bacterium]